MWLSCDLVHRQHRRTASVVLLWLCVGFKLFSLIIAAIFDAGFYLLNPACGAGKLLTRSFVCVSALVVVFVVIQISLMQVLPSSFL